MPETHYAYIAHAKPALRSPPQTNCRKRDAQIKAVFHNSNGRYLAFHPQDKRLFEGEQRAIEMAFKRLNGRDPDPETYEGSMWHFGGLFVFDRYSELLKEDERRLVRLAFRRVHAGVMDG